MEDRFSEQLHEQQQVWLQEREALLQQLAQGEAERTASLQLMEESSSRIAALEAEVPPKPKIAVNA